MEAFARWISRAIVSVHGFSLLSCQDQSALFELAKNLAFTALFENASLKTHQCVED